jgi:hypothetical protein
METSTFVTGASYDIQNDFETECISAVMMKIKEAVKQNFLCGCHVR